MHRISQHHTGYHLQHQHKGKYMVSPRHDDLSFPSWKRLFLLLQHLQDEYLESQDTAQVEAWNFESSDQQSWSDGHEQHIWQLHWGCTWRRNEQSIIRKVSRVSSNKKKKKKTTQASKLYWYFYSMGFFFSTPKNSYITIGQDFI